MVRGGLTGANSTAFSAYSMNEADVLASTGRRCIWTTHVPGSFYTNTLPVPDGSSGGDLSIKLWRNLDCRIRVDIASAASVAILKEELIRSMFLWRRLLASCSFFRSAPSRHSRAARSTYLSCIRYSSANARGSVLAFSAISASLFPAPPRSHSLDSAQTGFEQSDSKRKDIVAWRRR